MIDDELEKNMICRINNSHDFYSAVTEIFEKKRFFDIEFEQNDKYYNLTQLSGSCTYYGVYYFLYYYALNNNKLSDFLEITKKITNNACSEILNRFNTNNKITDSEMNIIQFIKEKYEFDVNSLIIKYNNNIMENKPNISLVGHGKSKDTDKNNYDYIIVEKIEAVKRSDNILDFFSNICSLSIYYNMIYSDEDSKLLNFKSRKVVPIYDDIIRKLIESVSDRVENFYHISKTDISQLLNDSFIASCIIESS